MEFKLFTLYILFINLMTFLLFGFDKLKAKSNGSRVPERTLHLFELLGGVFGSFAAMKLFNHKRKKNSFKRVSWTILAVYILITIFFTFQSF